MRSQEWFATPSCEGCVVRELGRRRSGIRGFFETMHKESGGVFAVCMYAEGRDVVVMRRTLRDSDWVG